MTKVSTTSGLSRTSGRVIAVCSSEKKGTPKTDVGEGIIEVGFGLKGDAHGGAWHRQVSLLAIEQIETMKDKGFDVKPGSFAENICTEGFDHVGFDIGDRLRIGQTAILEVTQIGKECHTRCAIYNKIGECIMPEQGVFAKVIEGGVIRTGDTLEVLA
ncbi:MAG: MOSC domain-containing protein [Deltaproteobacteria bacterium]|nr:MOSC domain-containing protein [Deltaproteobacteria bacterium]